MWVSQFVRKIRFESHMSKKTPPQVTIESDGACDSLGHRAVVKLAPLWFQDEVFSCHWTSSWTRVWTLWTETSGQELAALTSSAHTQPPYVCFYSLKLKPFMYKLYIKMVFPVPWNLHLSSCRWVVLCGRSLSTTWHSSRRCCRPCRGTRLDLQRPNASRVFWAWWRRYLLSTTCCCHVGVAYLLSDVTSDRCVLGVGGCSFLLHCGQSEQHRTLQYSPSTPV